MTLNKNIVSENPDSIKKEAGSHGISPCLYHAGMKCVLVGEKKSCSITRLHQMIERGLVAEAEIGILRIVAQFGCVTRHTLTDAVRLSDKISENNKNIPYKRVLNRLVRYGVLKRFCFSYEKDGSSTISHTPCFYMLTAASFEYIRKTFYSPAQSRQLSYPQFSDTEMLKRAIFLQFHNSFLKQDYAIQKNYLFYRIRKGLHSTLIYGIYRVQKKSDANDLLDIFVLPIRSQPGFQKELFFELSLMEDFAKQNTEGFSLPVYLFLCESSVHAKHINDYLKKTPLYDIPYLFLMDQSLMESDIFGKTFRITASENKEEVLSLFSLDI